MNPHAADQVKCSRTAAGRSPLRRQACPVPALLAETVLVEQVLLRAAGTSPLQGRCPGRQSPLVTSPPLAPA